MPTGQQKQIAVLSILSLVFFMPDSQHHAKVDEASVKILNVLTKSWPMFTSVLVDSREWPFATIGAIAESVHWLRDTGFIVYETLLRDGLIVEVRGAAITQRGRAFFAGYSNAAAAGLAGTKGRVARAA